MATRGDAGLETRPWSPITLTILSIFMPLGSIVISIRNLERLGVIDSKLARFYVWGTAIFLASVVLLIWSLNPHAFYVSPYEQVTPLYIGSPLAVVILQLAAYRRWQGEHRDLGTRPWFTALLPTLGMTLVVAVIAGLAIGIFSAVFQRG